jgi:transposase-like protein
MLQISDDLLKYFKNFCLSPGVITLFVNMKSRFSLSYGELTEMMIIRGSSVDHSTLQRWVRRFIRMSESVSELAKNLQMAVGAWMRLISNRETTRF